MSAAAVTPDQFRVLCHALGLDEAGRGVAYRSHFVTDPGSVDWDACDSLAALGLMSKRQPTALTGGGHLFIVTDAGRDAVRRHAASLPRLSRGRIRYLAWLDADNGIPFGEWLRRGCA